MDEKEFKFPTIKKSIEDFIEDEDGNITRSKLVVIGTMIMVMSIMLSIDGYTKHGSHGSHSSHSSTSYVRSHTSHESHSNHGSHASHASHTSHSNTASHSNSLYSAEGDVSYGPSVSSIPSVHGTVQTSSPNANAVVANTTSSSAVLNASLPKVPRLQVPEGTDATAESQEASVNEMGSADLLIPEIPTAPAVPDTAQTQSFEVPNLENPIAVDLWPKD
jgi:hypothetical protein